MKNQHVVVGVLLAMVLMTPSVAAQDVPTIGETLGGQAGNVLNAIREGRQQVAQMNTEIQQARQQFWELYPDGDGLAEAEARYSRALLSKDLYYLHLQLARQLAPVPDAGERIGVMQRVIGEVDGGIHAMAQDMFFRWAGAVQARGLEAAAEEFADYARARSRAEYFVGPQSPLRSDDPKEYLLGVIMRGGEGFPSREQAVQQFDTLASIVGEEALLAGAGAGMNASRNDTGWRRRDPYYILEEGMPTGFGGQRQQQLVPPEPYINGAIRPTTPRGQVIAMLHAARPADGHWVRSWQHAQEAYQQLVAAHGEAQVQRAADLVERAPKDFVGGTKWVLTEPHVLGVKEREPMAAFMHLIGLPTNEFDRVEAAFNELAASREKVKPADFRVIHVATQELGIDRLAGVADDVLYALATTPSKSHIGERYNTIVRLNADGSDVRIVHKFNGDESEGEWDTDQERTTLYVGPGGVLYGSIGKGLWVSKPGRVPGRVERELRHPKGVIYRVNADGSDFKLLRAFSDEDGTGGRLRMVDKQGVLSGTIHNSRLFGQRPPGTPQQATPWGIFRMEPDGSGFSILYHRWNLGPEGRSFLSLVDGDDGYLYGAQQAMEPNPHKRGVRVWTEIFRLPKRGGDGEVLHVGPTLETEARTGPRAVVIPGIAMTLVVGGDGALYGHTNYGVGGDAGHLFRINRDGSGYTVLHRLSGWASHVTEAHGFLYFFGNDGSGGIRLCRLAGDGKSRPTIFDADVVALSVLDLMPRAHDHALYGIYLKQQPDRAQRATVYRIGLSSLPAPIAYSSGAARPADTYRQSLDQAAQQQEQQRAALEQRMRGPLEPAAPTTAPTPRQPDQVRQPARNAPPQQPVPAPAEPFRAEQAIEYDGVHIEFTGGDADIAELKTAAANNARACLLLGELAAQGKIEGDDAEAVKWFEQGHELGDAECTARLALHLMTGRGVDEDDPRRSDGKVRQLVQTAAGRRSPLGIYLMAECLAKGIGGPKNEHAARSYYVLAASLGQPLAQKWCEENNVYYRNRAPQTPSPPRGRGPRSR